MTQAMTIAFDFRLRTPEGPLGRAVASVWYARGTVPYRRERVAPTGSTVAVIVLGDPIIETAGGPKAVPAARGPGVPHRAARPAGHQRAHRRDVRRGHRDDAGGVSGGTRAGSGADRGSGRGADRGMGAGRAAAGAAHRARGSGRAGSRGDARPRGGDGGRRAGPRRPGPRPLRARGRDARRGPAAADRGHRRRGRRLARAPRPRVHPDRGAVTAPAGHGCCAWSGCCRRSTSTAMSRGPTSPRRTAGRTSRT